MAAPCLHCGKPLGRCVCLRPPLRVEARKWALLLLVALVLVAMAFGVVWALGGTR